MALFVQYLHLIASLPFLTEHHVKVCRIHYTQSWIGLWAHNEFDRPVKISSSYSLQKNVLFISCLRLTELGKKMSTIMLSPILYFILFFPALFLLKVWLYHQRETAPFLNGIIGVIFFQCQKKFALLGTIAPTVNGEAVKLLLFTLYSDFRRTWGPNCLPSSLPPSGGALTVFRLAGFLLANYKLVIYTAL